MTLPKFLGLNGFLILMPKNVNTSQTMIQRKCIESKIGKIPYNHNQLVLNPN